MAVNCFVLPIATEAGDGVTAMETSVAVAPVPLSETFCGLLVAFPLKLNVPVLLPVAPGVKVIEVVQLAPPASRFGLIGQVVVDTAKSTRLELMPEILRVPVWLLVKVTDIAALVVPFV